MAQEVLKATVVETATGKVVGQLTGASWEGFELGIRDNPAWHLEEGHRPMDPVPPSMDDVRFERNRLIEASAWTIREDSPLANKDEWLAYLTLLQRITLDYTTPESVIWPAVPAYVYADSV